MTNTVEALRSLAMPVPDSGVARRARELIGDVEPMFLAHHSIRSYAWAVALASLDHLEFDPEILYVAALLHDIGLVPSFDKGGCFEFDGAEFAEGWAIEAGMADDSARAVRDAIVLHMAAEMPPDAGSESVLLSQSTGTDVRGYRLEEIRRRWFRASSRRFRGSTSSANSAACSSTRRNASRTAGSQRWLPPACCPRSRRHPSASSR